MARMSLETRRRVITWHLNGMKRRDIHSQLKGEGTRVTLASISRLIKKYNTTGSIADKVRSTPAVPKLLQIEHLSLLDEALAKDDQISISELQQLLLDSGKKVSRSVVQRAKNDLGKIALTSCVPVTLTTCIHYNRLGLNCSSLLSAD